MASPLLLWVRCGVLDWWQSALFVSNTLALDGNGSNGDEEDTEDSWAEGTISSVELEDVDESSSASLSDSDDIPFVEHFVAGLSADSLVGREEESELV